MNKNREITKLKRELSFDVKIKGLNQKWSNYNELLMLKNTNYGIAEIWKRQVYNIQHNAAVALFYAYSNQHPDYGHRIIRNDGKIVFSSQVIIKAFYLRYCILLLQGCGDKLAQLVRSAFEITKWKRIEDGRILEGDDAKEDNTTLPELRNYLNLRLKEGLAQKDKELFQKLFLEIKRYLKDKVVRKIIFESANAIKHRWQLFYQGEGLEPIKPEIRNIRAKGGRTIVKQLPIGAYTFGENIEEHIKLCLHTNNMFVDMANAILEHLNFDQFYEV